MKKAFVFIGFWLLLIFIFQTFAYSAPENLDEVINRKDRKTTNTFYCGESNDNSFLWQPQTLCYTDVITDHEVWVMSSVDNVDVRNSDEYAYNPWSANGNRYALAIDRDTAAFTRGNFYSNHIWLTSLADGSGMRPRIGAPSRTMVHSLYTQWSPTVLDTYYAFGRNYSSEGFSTGHLYKATVSDIGVSSSDIITVSASERTLNKQAISSDGIYALATKFAEASTIAICDLVSENLELAEYNMDRDEEDTHWLNTPADTSGWHDEMFVGNSSQGYWVYYLFTVSVGGAWWRARPWGTDGNAPNFTQDDTDPYAWWEGTTAQKEIQAVNGIDGTIPTHSIRYWSHGSPDRWGTHMVYSDTENDGGVGPGVADVSNETTYHYGAHDCQYHAWTGWTDYVVGTAGDGDVYRAKYNDNNSWTNILTGHIDGGNRGQFAKPGQSPDGTKVAFRSDFLQPKTTNGDVFYVVAYYPYSPEITQCNASGGTVTTRFDWRTNQANPRGYTTRGWPDEDSDDPPPPRETEKFRLWRSTDQSIWTPINTTNAEIFSRYNFSDGTWSGNNYWEITDAPGDGTWYYAVTSLEWSGLESHVLSNVYAITISSGSGTGSQSNPYPANPGGDNNFYTTNPAGPSGVISTHRKSPATAYGQYTIEWNKPNDNMIRYFNIYAEDGFAPTVSQTNRIASIPASACSGPTCSWVDWLGNQNGTTQYVVTSVDYQGNEAIGVLSGFKIKSVQH